MMRCIDHPTMIKDGSGWGAMTGAAAVHLAREGFTGAPAITIEGADVAEFWGDIGSRWRISEQYFKAYPVCRWAQPAIEAAAQLQRDHRFAHGDIEAITVRTFHEAYKLATAEPRDTDAAQYSLPFPVAALLVRGKVGPEEIDAAALGDADILRLSRMVEPVDDPRFSALFPAERWAEVEFRLADGRLLRSDPAVARGSAENPLSDAEVSEKFHGLMLAGGVAERARRDRGHGDGPRPSRVLRAAGRGPAAGAARGRTGGSRGMSEPRRKRGAERTSNRGPAPIPQLPLRRVRNPYPPMAAAVGRPGRGDPRGVAAHPGEFRHRGDERAGAVAVREGRRQGRPCDADRAGSTAGWSPRR